MKKEQIFTSDEFIAMLLRMFYNNGIYEIKEEELSKKLYSYYNNPKFKELFEDMKIMPATDQVDISKSMKHEKYFGQGMWWAIGDELLHLDYSYNNNSVKKYRKKLSQEGILLMNSIVDDFSKRYKVESESKYYMNIYGIDPNKKYCLNHNNCLLTDGNIKVIKKSELQIKSAKYVVIQICEKRRIQQIDVYTELTDMEVLSQISELANKEYYENGSSVLCDESYVKKIALR